MYGVCKLFGKINISVGQALARHITADAPMAPKLKPKLTKTVFISQSNDVFTNLALEDWLYKNFDFSNHHLLLMWRNNPCVVIGRHQNPWVETCVAMLNNKQIDLARRNSGGGAVFHDLGNLNCTFFTSRKQYNRRVNLEMIVAALKKEWDLPLRISQREDIMFDENYKVSGTAAKLGRDNAYHHCTVLVDVDTQHLGSALHKKPIEGSITPEKVLSAVGWQFLQTQFHDNKTASTSKLQQNGFQLVNPSEDWFPGINDIRKELMSWDWIYGKTPTFNLIRSFPIPANLLAMQTQASGPDPEFTIQLKVTKGMVDDVILRVPPEFLNNFSERGQFDVVTPLKGKPFSEDAMNELESFLETLKDTLNETDMFVVNCMKQMVQTV